MAEISWFKVLNDIFGDDKIKIIQSMPEGDSILVMWFKILAQSSKTNDGGYIYMKKNIPYTAGMLSTLFGKPQQLVELALRTFNEFGMIDVDENGYIFVTNWEKHQNIEGMEKVKEQNRLRSANYRERKRQELLGSNVISSRDVTLPSQQNNAIELDIDKELKHIVDSDECDMAFERWYSIYPKPGSIRKTAHAKWKLLWKSKKISMEELMTGTHSYLSYQEHNQYKVCAAQVFLNQERWRDDWTINASGGFPKGPKEYVSYRTIPQPDVSKGTDEEMEWLRNASREQDRRRGIAFDDN